MTSDEIVRVAGQIRQILLREFPEWPNLKNQCKRAGILLDLYRKRHHSSWYPTAGFITKDLDTNDHQRGHVWTIVHHDHQQYILDVTITQFEEYLKLPVPSVVFMPWRDAQILYGYRPDGYGVYEYEVGDVRSSLIEHVNQIS